MRRAFILFTTCIAMAAVAKQDAPSPGTKVALPPFDPAIPNTLTAESGVVMDEASGQILWSKNLDVRMFPASTTKIMTAMLTLEHCMLDDKIKAPKFIESVPPSSLHLSAGEVLSAKDLVYAMMLRSANDACVAAAVHIAGSNKAFAAKMNERAKVLGCKNTTFQNPNGLNNPNHKTTARDLAIIARAAMQIPEFREIVATQSRKIYRSSGNLDNLLFTKNKFLKYDSTADGIKTGWTIPSGHCYVGSATRKGFRIITVLLKSSNWTRDNKELLNWAFSKYGMRTVATPNDPILEAKISNGTKLEVPIAPRRDVKLALPIAEGFAKEDWRMSDSAPVVAPIRKGESMGKAQMWRNGKMVIEVPVVALDTVLVRPVPQKRMLSSLGNLPSICLAGVLAGSALLMRRKSRTIGV